MAKKSTYQTLTLSGQDFQKLSLRVKKILKSRGYASLEKVQLQIQAKGDSLEVRTLSRDSITEASQREEQQKSQPSYYPQCQYYPVYNRRALDDLDIAALYGIGAGGLLLILALVTASF